MRCEQCKYWSMMLAQATINGVEAMCLHEGSPRIYRNENFSCSHYKYGPAVDDPNLNFYPVKEVK